MNALLIVTFAFVAAIGNALFALGQRQSVGIPNGLLFVSGSALVGCVLAALSARVLGTTDIAALRGYLPSMVLSGVGLFLTYAGFHLLYSRFGASAYVVYAALSIVTTTVGVGFLYLREAMTRYHLAAVLLAVTSVVLFALGQLRLAQLRLHH